MRSLAPRVLFAPALLGLAAVGCSPHTIPATMPMPTTTGATASADPGAGASVSPGVEHVRVTTRIIVVDREALTRAGLAYVLVGNDRVQVSASDRAGSRRSRGVRIGVGTHGVQAFLDAVRDSRWVRSESTQQILTISGGEGRVASQDLSVGRGVSRTQGPSLIVSPTALDDGSVHLRVSARIEDSVDYAWGYGVDGSPAAVDSEVIARTGQEVVLASSSSVQSTREAGILSWGAAEHGRDVLVVMTAEVVRH